MRKVRIVRNTVNFRQALFRLNRLFLVIFNIYLRHTQDANRDYITQLRAEKIAIDTQVAEMRRQKLSDELVLLDFKIERERRELGLTDHPFTEYKD